MNPRGQAESLPETDQASSHGELAPVFSTAPARPRILWLLIAVLPLFGQTFHYIKALMPLWALSKAWPILSLPLALHLMRHPRFPMSRQMLLSFAWLLLLPSLAAMFYFHEGFFTSITAQVKLLPLLYFFSFLALLLILQPTLHELERGFLFWGAVVSAALILLAIVVPDSWYQGSYALNAQPFFSSDNRGHRMRMSMYFPIVMLFFCYRRAWFERSLRYLLGMLVAFAVTALIVKTRAMIIGIVGVVALNSIVWARPRTRLLLLVLAPVALAGIFSVGYLATIFDTGADSGLEVKVITMQLATGFLGDSPLRWLFGVGSISPTSSDSLIAYFNHAFFLSDITWLGIIFEYGICGALLWLFVELRGLAFYRRLRTKVEDDFLGALADYIIYVLLISPFYPLTLTPGETTVILAIFVYVWHAGGLEHNDIDSRSPHAQAQTS
ncbi:hypothetical protein [Bordetella sp. FB-8]|uniref:hypothetical protein n=1 Tax=Bordetella sp. FB-8 TaxID=1159870 RepID=UPI0003676041|nr:hypothetical protein [Bordetella sp. FB-8]